MYRLTGVDTGKREINANTCTYTDRQRYTWTNIQTNIHHPHPHPHSPHLLFPSVYQHGVGSESGGGAVHLNPQQLVIL